MSTDTDRTLFKYRDAQDHQLVVKPSATGDDIRFYADDLALGGNSVNVWIPREEARRLMDAIARREPFEYADSMGDRLVMEAPAEDWTVFTFTRAARDDEEGGEESVRVVLLSARLPELQGAVLGFLGEADRTETPADGKPEWLALAEREEVEATAATLVSNEKWAADVARHVNERLAILGIKPLHPATTDGEGDFIPAILLYAIPDEKLFEVHAGFDEETNGVMLLGAAHDDPELRDLHLSIGDCTPAEARRRVLLAHRRGPAPQPPKPEPLPPHVKAIVEALNDIHGTLQSMYSYGIGQV